MAVNTYMNINAANVNGGSGGGGFPNPADANLDMAGFDILNVGELTSPANATFSLVSAENNGASAVGFELDTSNALSTAGAKIVSIKTNNVEKLAISKDGDILQAGGNAIWTVLPSEGGAGIQAAVIAAATAGGGIVQLQAGTYTIPNGTGGTNEGIVWPTDSNNVWLRGVGPETVLASQVETAEYTLLLDNVLAGGVEDQACSNIAANDAQVTLTTAANAANFLKGIPVCIQGTDAEGYHRFLLNEVAANGNGGTGVVTLTGTIRFALTSVTITGFTHGIGNKVSDLKITHTAGASHAIGLKTQFNCVIENVQMDGLNFSSSYAVEISQESSRIKIRNCDIRNYKYDGASANGNGLLISSATDVMIENTWFHKNGDITGTEKSNILINAAAENLTFKNCDIQYSTSYGIQFQNDKYILDVLIDGCRFDNNSVDGVFINDDAKQKNIRIVNCEFRHNVQHGVRMLAKNSLINNCTFIRNLSAGIRIDANSLHNIIDGNIFDSNQGDGGIANYASKTTITGNSGSNNVVGCYLVQGDDVTVSGNNFSNNTAYGLRIDAGSRINVLANTLINNTTNNIRLANGVTNVRLLGNNLPAGTESMGTSTSIEYDKYQSFTPTVTLTGGAGNTVPVYTTNTGRFWRVGNEIQAEVYLTGDGGAEGAGTGLFNVALPVAASASNPTSKFPCGYALNNAAEYEIWGQIAASATTITLQYFNAINTTVNFTGDDQNNATRTVRLKFSYEA